jgi:hypothetical protein
MPLTLEVLVHVNIQTAAILWREGMHRAHLFVVEPLVLLDPLGWLILSVGSLGFPSRCCWNEIAVFIACIVAMILCLDAQPKCVVICV